MQAMYSSLQYEQAYKLSFFTLIRFCCRRRLDSRKQIERPLGLVKLCRFARIRRRTLYCYPTDYDIVHSTYLGNDRVCIPKTCIKQAKADYSDLQDSQLTQRNRASADISIKILTNGHWPSPLVSLCHQQRIIPYIQHKLTLEINDSQIRFYSKRVGTYTVSQKNDTDVTHYRFNPHQPMSVIFGRDVADRVCY